MSDQRQQLEMLCEEWAAAELRGDTAYLERTLADESFGLDEVQVRPYGDAAVTVCRQSAEGVYEDENGHFDIKEQFRVTLVFVRQRGSWLLAGLQLSPILGRP